MMRAPTVTIVGIITTLIRLSGGKNLQHEAEDYLAKFGYIKASTSGKTAALQSLDSAIADFQAFAGLEQTGELDEETVKMMHTPRCGVKDFVEEDEDTPRMRLRNSRRRGKRYALQGSRWKVKDLTYRVSKYPFKSRLTRREVDDTMR